MVFIHDSGEGGVLHAWDGGGYRGRARGVVETWNTAGRGVSDGCGMVAGGQANTWVHGLACWFDVQFKGSREVAWLSTAPGQPTTHWCAAPLSLMFPADACLKSAPATR